LIKPYRKQIDTDKLPEEVSNRLMAEAYAKAVVINAQVKIGEEDGEVIWEDGIEASDGSVLPYTEENLIHLFLSLPEMFIDLQGMAGQAANYQKEEDEADVKT